MRPFMRAALLLAISMALVFPLLTDGRWQRDFNTGTRSLLAVGGPLVGLDFSSIRVNPFSLVRDMSRDIRVLDHSAVLHSRMLGLVVFMSRGQIATTADALRWFSVPLTARQALAVDLCKPLDTLKSGEQIVIAPDPWQKGIASWYGPGFHGRMAASGEIFNMFERTAAHKTLPLQSMVRVVATRTGRSTVVRINDRGPYVGGRIIDLSHRSKELLGMEGGLAQVYIERLDPVALEVPCE